MPHAPGRLTVAVPLLGLALLAKTGCGAAGPTPAGGAMTMYFVPSQARAPMARAAKELARFVADDGGLRLEAEIPAAYADVIAALADGRADVAWLPPVAYLIAHREAGAVARLQVVRTFEQSVVVVVRSGPGEPSSLGQLAGRPVAVPRSLDAELRLALGSLLAGSPGWREVTVASDREAVRALFDGPSPPAAAASSWVFSGPEDLVGDGRKELEAERPGTLAATRAIGQVEPPLERRLTTYRGAFVTRTDSGIRSPRDLAGRTVAYTDEASTSGFVFPRALLQRLGVQPAAEYFVGSHPRVVQEVWAGRVEAGAVYYSPPGAGNRSSGQLVGDARGRALERLATDDDRLFVLERVRVVALTDPIPSDVCCVRRQLPDPTWARFDASVGRFLATADGRAAFGRLVGGTEVATTSDQAFDDLRHTLDTAGVDVGEILRLEEAKLRRTRGG